jgi:hypothetical protein
MWPLNGICGRIPIDFDQTQKIHINGVNVDKSNRTNRLFFFLAPLGIACVAALLLLKSLGAPTTPPLSLTSTPGPTPEIVARVGEQPITFADWTVAFYLDALMSHFSGQPAPVADETLDRLVNDALILTAAAQEGISVNQSEVETRAALLLADWRLTEDQVAAEVSALGLSREAGIEAIARLLTVERYLTQVVWAGVPVEEQTSALDAWLQTRRAQVGVEIDAHRRQPSLPASLSFSTAMPPPSPPSNSTATPLAASPLATPIPPPPAPTATPLTLSPLPLPAPSLAAGQPAPDFALSDANAQTIRLSDYRNRRQVVVVFFRTTG